MAGADDRAPSGMAVGSGIALIFGLVFVEANSGGLPGSWAAIVRIAGVVVAALLAVAVALVVKKGAAPGVEGGGFNDRRYWNIVGVEALALFGGLAIINNVFERPEFAVPWIAFVVGVHFVVLARAWKLNLFLPLGVVQAVLGVVGFVLAGSGVATGTVDAVAGVGSGVALFATVAAAVVVTRSSREVRADR